MLRLALLCSLATLPVAAATVVRAGDGDASWWKEGAQAPASFGVIDADRDGTVSLEELSTARRQLTTAIKETKASLLAASDQDQNGKLSRYEAAEAMPRWVSLRERARDIALAAEDKDGDGRLSAKESSTLERRIAETFARYGAAGVDADRDRNFSRPEVQSAIRSIIAGDGTLFALCDTNNDGQLSVKESGMAFELLAAAADL